MTSQIVPQVPTTTRIEVTVTKADISSLDRFWPEIREGLLSIKSKSEASSFSTIPMGHWQPGHVRAAVIGGFSGDIRQGAELWIGLTPSTELAGFSVTNLNFEPFLNIPYAMFVWVAYATPKIRSNVVFAMDRHLTEVARGRGLEYLEAMTKRVALPRRLAPLGWQQHLLVIRKPLWNTPDMG